VYKNSVLHITVELAVRSQTRPSDPRASKKFIWKHACW